MDFSADIQIVSLDLFDAAFLVTPADEEAVKLRFMTLFVYDEGGQRGGSGDVRKARNAQGEVFAIKRLRIAEPKTNQQDESREDLQDNHTEFNPSITQEPDRRPDASSNHATPLTGDAQALSCGGLAPSSHAPQPREDDLTPIAGNTAARSGGLINEPIPTAGELTHTPIADIPAERASELTHTPISTPSAENRQKLIRGSLASQSGATGTPDYVTAGHVAAFYEEYRVHLAVSNLRGFPKLYGFGLVNGDPLIIMEWVEGVTLREAMRRADLFPLETNASIGIAVLELLERAAELEDHFVHRDISPRNIMLRTDRTPAEQQLETNAFDICLIDFGSAALSMQAQRDPTFTMSANVWRLGTPAYAPPEMLTHDIALPEGSRQSETIDTYALGSVLYELYTGHKPFHIGPDEALSPYRLKTERTPEAFDPRKPDGGAFCQIILQCLSVSQGERPTVHELKAALENWLDNPEQRAAAPLRAPVFESALTPERQTHATGTSTTHGGAQCAGAPHAGAPHAAASHEGDGVLAHEANPSGKTATHATTKPERATNTIWQEGYAKKTVTRRRFIAGGIVLAAAAATGIIVASKPRAGAPDVDPSRYATTSEPYAGEPLFKALDRNQAGWMLCTAAGDIACKPDSSRECGALREGLVALYDDISQLYGYIAPTESGEYAWKILPAFAQAADFSENLAAAQDPQTKLWGYVDADGIWAINPQFHAANAFSSGIATAQVSASDASWTAIDAAGAPLFEPRFTELGTHASAGYFVAEDGAGNWGIVDEQGAWTSEMRFPQLRRFVAGLAPALDSERDLWGYVNEQGAWVIAPSFKDARAFSRVEEPDSQTSSTAATALFVAAVQDPKTQLWYFISADGTANADMKPRFWKLGDIHDGLAPAQASAQDSTVIFDESDPDARAEYAGMRYGYVDAAGNWQMRRLTELVDTAIGSPEI